VGGICCLTARLVILGSFGLFHLLHLLHLAGCPRSSKGLSALCGLHEQLEGEGAQRGRQCDGVAVSKFLLFTSSQTNSVDERAIRAEVLDEGRPVPSAMENAVLSTNGLVLTNNLTVCIPPDGQDTFCRQMAFSGCRVRFT